MLEALRTSAAGLGPGAGPSQYAVFPSSISVRGNRAA
jgi:hypothetical protein